MLGRKVLEAFMPPHTLSSVLPVSFWRFRLFFFSSFSAFALSQSNEDVLVQNEFHDHQTLILPTLVLLLFSLPAQTNPSLNYTRTSKGIC
ncbi:hypothetical protein VTH06DRAFT_6702 [Thermothelomyces fergusii]